MKQIFRNLKQ